MGGSAAIILAAGLIYTDWYCSSGLVPGPDTPQSTLKISFSLLEDDLFEARGTVQAQGIAHNFAWVGTWADVDGQLAMIGQTQGRTFGVAPAGELRAVSSVIQGDVILLDLSSDENPRTALRCLTYALE